MIALNGMLLVMALTDWHWPWPLGVAFALAVPMLLGYAHGLLITRFNMQPFIVTLCGLLLYRGIARFIANDTTKGFGEATVSRRCNTWPTAIFLACRCRS